MTRSEAIALAKANLEAAIASGERTRIEVAMRVYEAVLANEPGYIERIQEALVNTYDAILDRTQEAISPWEWLKRALKELIG